VACSGEKGTYVEGVPWNRQARQCGNRNRCNGLLCEFRAALRIRKYLPYKIHTLLRNHWTSEKYLVLIVLRQPPSPQRVPGGTSDLQMSARRSSHLIRNHSTSKKFLVLIVLTPQPSYARRTRAICTSLLLMLANIMILWKKTHIYVRHREKSLAKHTSSDLSNFQPTSH